MEVIYKAIKTKDENGRLCYGIGMLMCYRDVFKNEVDAKAFADLCNSGRLSEVHFNEVIDDYINK